MLFGWIRLFGQNFPRNLFDRSPEALTHRHHHPPRPPLLFLPLLSLSLSMSLLAVSAPPRR